MKRRLPYLLFAGAVITVQIATRVSGAEYFLTQLIMTAWFALVVIGLCLLMGYAGQISLGHSAFFAIGGYTTAVIATTNLLPLHDNPFIKLLGTIGMTASGTDVWGAAVVHLSPWVGLVAAVLASAVAAFLIGIPALRLKGHYLAMATLGFGMIIYRLVLGTQLFGGADGLSDIPPFTVLPGLIIDGSTTHRIGCYYFAWGLVLLAMILTGNLINSRAGRALRAIHGNEEAAAAMGINTARYKLALFVLSACMAAIAGVFMTHYNGGIGPAEAGVMKSVRYVAIVAVGGMANLWGALIAGAVLNFLSLRGYFGSYDDAVFGAVLVAMMLFAPNGILTKKRTKKTNPCHPAGALREASAQTPGPSQS
jgi:branched-chain amino acid transport system permease protein